MASEPADGAATVAVDQALSVSFSKRLDVTSLNAQSVVLVGAEGSVEIKVRIPAKPGHRSDLCRASIPINAGPG